MDYLSVIELPNAFYGANSEAQKLGSSPGSFISSLIPNIMIIAGVLFFGLIIYAGFNIIVTAGGDPKSLAKSKETMTYGIIGFLIVVSAYFILQIISVTLTGNANTLINPKL